MDKIQQAIIYNARVNEKEHKDLDKKIKIVSDNINEVKTELETKLENIELIPGEKGEPGKDGIDGKDGLNGKDGYQTYTLPAMTIDEPKNLILKLRPQKKVATDDMGEVYINLDKEDVKDSLNLIKI